MSYDDIRFSGWDDPDNDEDLSFLPDDWEDSDPNQYGEVIDMGYDYEFEDDEPFTQECVMCGKERVLNEKGYCSECWQIWNS